MQPGKLSPDEISVSPNKRAPAPNRQIRPVKRWPILRNVRTKLMNKPERIICCALHAWFCYQNSATLVENHLQDNEKELDHLFHHAQIGVQMAV